MKLTFLGTGGSTPTKDRGLTSVALSFEGKIILFDCPEGTQRQMMKSGISFMKVSHIFLSHFHADHFLGIPGLLATMAIHGRSDPLIIFGPKGVKEKINQLIKLSNFILTFEVKTVELRKGIALKEEKFNVSAFKLKHELNAFGFVFKEKDKKGEFNRKKAEALGIPVGPLYSKLAEGKKIKVEGKEFKPEMVMDYSKGRKGRKISVVFDTLAMNSIAKIVSESDVLIHEATFLDEQAERAKETLHSTALQAARIASKAKVKKLYLIHFSPRIKEIKEIEIEAKKEFPNAKAAQDFEELDL